jgi:DnaJ like chaperone protein
MSIWSTIAGGAAGLARLDVIGKLILNIFGSPSPRDAEERPVDETTRSAAFTIGVIALGAKMAKADGAVSRDEIRAFRQVFRVDDAEVKNVARVFDLARRDGSNFEVYAKQVAGLFEPRAPVLEELLDCLFHIATADGPIGDAELAYLRRVGEIFGFDGLGFDRIRASHGNVEACEPCLILGVAPEATPDQIKSAYRQLAVKYHPDRLIAAGLPTEAIRVATEKLAVINDAYSRLRDQRGFV